MKYTYENVITSRNKSVIIWIFWFYQAYEVKMRSLLIDLSYKFTSARLPNHIQFYRSRRFLYIFLSDQLYQNKHVQRLSAPGVSLTLPGEVYPEHALLVVQHCVLGMLKFSNK